MKHEMHRRQVLALAALPIATSGALASGGVNLAAIPLERFFEPEECNGAWLNPSGTKIVLRMANGGNRRRLVVVDLETLKLSALPSVTGTDVDAVQWVNDRRLVFSTQDERKADARLTDAPGLIGVDVDGRRSRVLISRTWFNERDIARDLTVHPFDNHLVPGLGPQIDDRLWMQRSQDWSEGGFYQLQRLNTVTGQVVEAAPPARSREFVFDAKGELCGAYLTRSATRKLMWRFGEHWKELESTEGLYADYTRVIGQAGDGTWYASVLGAAGRRALFRFDPERNQLSEKPLFGLAQFDVSSYGLIFSDAKLLGVQVLADARTVVWFDEDMKALQARVDELLPATQNLLQVPRRGKSPFALVEAFSDRRPSRYLLLNRESMKLTLLGSARPSIDPAQMSPMEFVTFKARDGRPIPAYLTLPKARGDNRPPPMVVLVHGGPFMRGGSWEWQAEVQFLASRGYAVLQPEFRGSTGFGSDHFTAGWKQWGLAMQDDLADAARWAVAQGHADAKRIAIMGGSYGGYAALMGLVNDPDVFRCAINMYGITDLSLMFSENWDDLSDVWREHGLTQVLGDLKKDTDRLKATSPLHQAHRIKAPVLMAYGRADRRVDIVHGERLRNALRDHNQNVEWVSYLDEGHGWRSMETHKDFWPRVERFLAKHLI